MVELFNAENLTSLVTLTLLEVVLGIDNVILIALLVGRLPERQQGSGRWLGFLLATLMRILLLVAANWMRKLEQPLFSLLGHGFTGRDLLLLGGGLFLIAKGTFEIHDKLEGAEEHVPTGALANSFGWVMVQVALLNIVFSLDSVITAVGMARHLEIMIAAVLLSVVFMLGFAGVISRFVEHHPTIKMLALAFILCIGVLLVAEGFHIEEKLEDRGKHLDLKGYVYFAMAFSLLIELLNIRVRKKARPVDLRQTYVALPTEPDRPETD